MAKLPPEKIGDEYDKSIMTRLFENVYKRLGKIDNNVIKTIVDTVRYQKGIDGAISPDVPMPTPINVRVHKIGAFVFASCDAIEMLKYPQVKGFQFFGSVREGFKPLVETALVTITGSQTDAFSGTTMMTVSAPTTSLILPARYTNMPFWSDMNLTSGTVGITNITDSSSATLSATAWDKDSPLELSAILTGGSDNEWQANDTFRLRTVMPKNLIGQGRWPLAFTIIWPIGTFWVNNPYWDNLSYYIKVRTYGKNGYSDVACASTTGYVADPPGNMTASDVITAGHNYYYYFLFARPCVDAEVEFDEVPEADFYEVRHTELEE